MLEFILVYPAYALETFLAIKLNVQKLLIISEN